MRFETLPPSLLERLGLDDEVESARQILLHEAAHTSRLAANTSLSAAASAALEVAVPSSPAFALLTAWACLTVIRGFASRVNARRAFRKHEKVL